MGLQVSLLAREYRTFMDIGSGILIGLWGSFIALFVVSRMSRISSLPSPLLSAYLRVSALLTFFRLVILAIPVGVATLATWPWIRVVLNAPPVFGYLPTQFPHRALLIGTPITLLVLLQFGLMTLFLDSRWGFRLKLIRDHKWIDRLRQAGNEGRIYPPIEEHLLTRILFSTSNPSRITHPFTYGGLIFRPRIVIPEDLYQRLEGDLEILLTAILLQEIAHIRRGDAFFETILRALRLPHFLHAWHSRWCECFCAAEGTALGIHDPDRHQKLFESRKSSQAVACLIALALSFLAWNQIQSALAYHEKYINRSKSTLSKDLHEITEANQNPIGQCTGDESSTE